MYIIPIYFITLVVLTSVGGSFFNPYPRYNFFEDEGDPGEPLFLTKYIENGDIETAQNLSLVTHPDINIPSHAGYFTVDKKFNSNLFFWFFPAKINSENAPVILWLQGGPGASSLFGLFTENGPFSVSSKQILIPRKYSWHSNHNLIYIDNPCGTGFSFTGSDDGYAKNELDVGQNLLAALQQFFLLFPNLQKNEFFLCGESYGGKYVPAFGYAIYQDSLRNDSAEKSKINLKGLAIGNGLSDPVHQLNYADYLYQLGIIDTNGHNLFVNYQDQGIECIKNRDFNCAFNIFNNLINMDQLPEGSLFKNLTGFDMYYNYLKTQDEDMSAMGVFLQKSVTRRAIHVGNNSFHDLEGENKVEEHLKLDIMDSVADWVSLLLEHYPVLIYNGQLDIIVAYPLTENYLKNLQFRAAEDYKTAKRFIWRVDDDVAGYVKHAGNLTEILVRNAGHMAPADQPKWIMDMISRFTYRKGFY